MSSGIDGGISGGGAADQGGGRGSAYRKNTKKFGKNLNKLTKAPAAPPVPVISTGPGGSSGSFRGSSSNRNGLLLLSTKSKSSSGIGVGSGGLLASSSTPKTAHDALLLSAGAGQGGGDPSKRLAAHAWGIGEKKQIEPVPLMKISGAEKTTGVDGNENPEPVVDRSNISEQPQKPLLDRSDVSEISEKVEALDLNKCDSSKKVDSDSSAKKDEKMAAEPRKDVSQLADTISIFQPKTKKDVESKTSDSEIPKAEKINQVEYMSKLAKERAEKLRLEEEARMAAQKERAAMRLRELEEKRLEERKKNLQIMSQERKELSAPSTQVVLEPLGKSKKDAPDSTSPRPILNSQLSEKKNSRTLFDPDRPFSSLVGGKIVANSPTKAAKDERPLEITKKPIINEPSPTPVVKENERASTDIKKNEPPPPVVQMVQLSNLDEIDRGGRGEEQGGPRMLFDPNSGSMVAVKSREDPKSMKKLKQKVSQKGPAKSSEDVGKVITRRVSDGVGIESSLRSKQGKGGSRKDDPLTAQQKVKKSVILDKARPNRLKKVPRTCGVLYKLDKSGNYLNADECNPDNGFGAHLVPGGRVKNPGAHAKLLKSREEKKTINQPNASTNATKGFSFRSDPGFIRHQTDFEAQQQKILEDAWASLIENDEQKSDDDERFEDNVPASKSGDDEYAAALAISPSMIGLNFDAIDNMDSVMLPPAIQSGANRNQEEPIDLVKFALGATNSTSVAKSANPFVNPLTSLWGAGTPGATNTVYGDLGALTAWTPIPFGESDSTSGAGSAGLNGSSSQASKLHLWGSSALDDGCLGAFRKK
ncbi:hypothetical protein ACHAXA_001144 [Cyclostephanos tholiformis]|uniref:Uncharacterized protein n=1 Tax=Cyclostephanos tholiformis TaxID=382380 RepID=A0ABD3R411_9STRA